MLRLLYQYVPEYDALGQTMGERLLEGFMSRVQDVTDWFESFNGQLAGMQQVLAQDTLAATEGFYGVQHSRETDRGGVVVNQNVSFHEPVESPAQVARRMADVNDALGQLLA